MKTQVLKYATMWKHEYPGYSISSYLWFLYSFLIFIHFWSFCFFASYKTYVIHAVGARDLWLWVAAHHGNIEAEHVAI